ncbi:MAG: hypothetical protein IIA67_15080, partial [Planctomycetes bacterium]|nr:hypothetical protein [Planctomycetota bacterium]
MSQSKLTCLSGEIVMWITNIVAVTACGIWLLCSHAAALADVALTGRVVDDKTGRSVAARLYIESVEGRARFAASVGGSAIRYRKQRGRLSSENHTSLSAHPFTLNVPPGEYVITVERGKEYVTWQKTVVVKDRPVDVPIRLRRWIDMAALGWYSGDTHVHRTLEELPLVMQSEDLNVALPLTDWVTSGHQPPRSSGDPVSAKLIIV